MIAVDILNVKHSSPGSSTLSDVTTMGTHWVKALSLNVKLSSSAVKSSAAKQDNKNHKSKEIIPGKTIVSKCMISA